MVEITEWMADIRHPHAPDDSNVSVTRTKPTAPPPDEWTDIEKQQVMVESTEWMAGVRDPHAPDDSNVYGKRIDPPLDKGLPALKEVWVDTLSHKQQVMCCPGGIGMHECYADGKPRPMLRGWLHGFVSIAVIPPLLVAVSVGLVTATLPYRWWTALGFLLGKGLSYAASSVFHLVPFKSVHRARQGLICDLMMIPVSVWATASPFLLVPEEWLSAFAIHAVFILLHGLLIKAQFKRDMHLVVPRPGSPIRLVIFAVQMLVTFAHIGLHYGYLGLWITGVFLYLLSFGAFAPAPGAQKKGIEPMSAYIPWHCLHRNGFHEDFHNVVFLADIILGCAAVNFLGYPEMDRQPHWR